MHLICKSYLEFCQSRHASISHILFDMSGESTIFSLFIWQQHQRTRRPFDQTVAWVITVYLPGLSSTHRVSSSHWRNDDPLQFPLVLTVFYFLCSIRCSITRWRRRRRSWPNNVPVCVCQKCRVDECAVFIYRLSDRNDVVFSFAHVFYIIGGDCAVDYPLEEFVKKWTPL